MRIIKQQDLEQFQLPGRIIQKAVGKDGFSPSMKMTIGFATYSEASGPMEPHRHAEEVVYVFNSKNGYVRYGKALNQLSSAIPLEIGMILHIPELEWHVFEFDNGGRVEIVFIYGQVDNIRPEEILERGLTESG